MAAPSTATGTVQGRGFVKLSDAAPATPANHAALVANGALAKGGANAGELGANEVAEMTGFGPIEQTGNPAEWTPHGSPTTKSIAGAASLGELPITFTILEANSLHGALLGGDGGSPPIGRNVECAYKKTVGAAEVIYYAKGTISSVSVETDTPSACSISIALGEAPKRFPKAG